MKSKTMSDDQRLVAYRFQVFLATQDWVMMKYS